MRTDQTEGKGKKLWKKKSMKLSWLFWLVFIKSILIILKFQLCNFQTASSNLKYCFQCSCIHKSKCNVLISVACGANVSESQTGMEILVTLCNRHINSVTPHLQHAEQLGNRKQISNSEYDNFVFPVWMNTLCLFMDEFWSEIGHRVIFHHSPWRRANPSARVYPVYKDCFGNLHVLLLLTVFP